MLQKIIRIMVVAFGCMHTLFSCATSDAFVPLSIPADLMLQVAQNTHVIAAFCLFVALLLFWTIIIGKLLNIILKLPVIAGQIIAGILFGPSLFDIAHQPFFAYPIRMVDYATGHAYALCASDLFVSIVLVISAALTVSYLMWIAGHETDIAEMYKVGFTAVSAGILGALVPIAVTVGAVMIGLGGGWTMVQAVGLGLAFAATSVSIPVAMLFAYHKMHLKSSKATLGAAVVDDIFAVILLSLFFLALQTGCFGTSGVIAAASSCSLGYAVAYMILAGVTMVGVGYLIIPRVIRALYRYHYAHLVVAAATGMMLLYFSFAELVGGLAGITGAYFAGLFHRRADHEHKAVNVITPFVNAILLPLFLGSIGLQINIMVLSLREWWIVFVLLSLAISAKFIGCWIATALSNRLTTDRWSGLETYIFGASMVARGEVGLVVATILYGSGVITPNQYIIGVIVIVLTTIAAPILLAWGFNRLASEPAHADEIISRNEGLFEVIGTERLFNIIAEQLEKHHTFKHTFQLSEGRKILNVEGQEVKIILSPEEGLIFEGNKRNIAQVVGMVKTTIEQEIARLQAPL